MDHRSSAREILSAIGGKDNLISAAHCSTRLRLIIADNSKVQKETLENIDVVKGVFEAAGQLQIIIGTGTVNKVYDEFIAESGIEAASKDELKTQAAQKQNWFKRLIKTLGDVFVPIIPAIVAGGLIMGIMEALNFMAANGFISLDTNGYVFTIFKLLSNAAFTFLPILIGYSATKVFGGNPYLGAVIGMFLIHPDLQNAWTVSANGYEQTFSIFGLFNVHMVGYQGHVIPIIIASFILAKIEKKLHKVVPDIIDLFVTPLVSLTVTAFLVYTFIGPVFVALENGIITGVQKLILLPFGVGSFIMGGFYSTTVVGGIHHMYTVIDIGQLAKYGATYWLPLASAANMAQGAACLAVAVRSKNNKIRSMAYPSALSCMLGITEPAIFGVNLRFVKPFIFGSIGGACGAMAASILHLGATATGVTGIFAILLTLNHPVKYIISMLIAMGVAFTLTWFFGTNNEQIKNESKPAEKSEKTEQTEQTEQTEKIAEITDTANTADTSDNGVITSPLSGKAVKLENVPDPTFAQGILGLGAAIEPTEGKVVAPADGKVETLFDTLHAVGLTLDNGKELLIHVGINTVALNGEGFVPHVSEGDRVTKGQTLITFDIDFIKSKGYQTVTPVLVGNSDDFSAVEQLAAEGAQVSIGDELIKVTD